MNVSGQASGFEKITVMPASGSSIYDASNNTASASYQLNNSAFLKATGSPVITQTTIDAFNTEITVKFLKPIYNTSGGTDCLRSRILHCLYLVEPQRSQAPRRPRSLEDLDPSSNLNFQPAALPMGTRPSPCPRSQISFGISMERSSLVRRATTPLI